MDLLSKRYASPFSLVDRYIEYGQFNTFVVKVITKDFEEQEERKMWEIYLHKVYDQSFSEWKEAIKNDMKKDEAIKTKDEIIQDSENILNSFNPQRG